MQFFQECHLSYIFPCVFLFQGMCLPFQGLPCFKCALDSLFNCLSRTLIHYLIALQGHCRTLGATNSPKSNSCQERCIPQPYSAFTQAPMTNTRGVDGRGQPSDVPTISPPATPLGFEPVTSALIPLVGPQALPTLLKAIVVRKCAYPSLIVHSHKHPR